MMKASENIAGATTFSETVAQNARPLAEEYVGKQNLDGIIAVSTTVNTSANAAMGAGNAYDCFQKRWTRDELMAYDPNSA